MSIQTLGVSRRLLGLKILSYHPKIPNALVVETEVSSRLSISGVCTKNPSMLSMGAIRFHFPIASQSLLLQQHQLHDPSSPVRFLSVFSTSQNQINCEEKEHSLNVSYLVNSCGLSPASAIHACKRIRLVNLEKSEAVVQLLKTHGFSLAQISDMIRRLPAMLLCNPEKTLMPKLNYLYSVGASKGDVIQIFSKRPVIFKRSLEKHIIPTFEKHQLHDPWSPVRFLLVFSTSQNQIDCEEKEHSLNVAYLVNSCGLSPASAIHACKRIRLVNLENSKEVIQLLKTHGFSLTQISDMIRSLPAMLLSNPEKTLMPKLNYLYSVGASEGDVIKIFSKGAVIFTRSLEKHIIPSFELLMDVVGSNKKAIETIKSYPWLLYEDLDKNFIPNITTLLDLKAPESGIFYLLRSRPSVLLMSSLHFVKVVEKVKTFGFNPSSSMFVKALHISSMSKATWDKKLKIFQKWGWSEEITHEAFRKTPSCMALSEDKINAVMHFFIDKAGIEASYLARFPLLLRLSLENRVIPRYTIAQVLLSRGVMKITNFNLNTLLTFSNQKFKEKFVIPYLREAPELLDIYQAKTATK